MYHSFDVTHASRYGLKEAILIHHFALWIRYNRKRKRERKDGSTWTYQTQTAISAHVSYLGDRWAIKNIVKSLVDQRVIKTGCFNRHGRDRTTWYAFEDELKFVPLDDEEEKELSQCEKSHTDNSKTSEQCEKSHTPMWEFSHALPCLKSHVLNEDMSVAEPPVGASAVTDHGNSELKKGDLPLRITLIGRRNVPYEITQDDLWREFVASGLDLRASELRSAYCELSTYGQTPVHDWWAFVKGFVRNQRNMIKSQHAKGKKTKTSKELEQCPIENKPSTQSWVLAFRSVSSSCSNSR